MDPNLAFSLTRRNENRRTYPSAHCRAEPDTTCKAMHQNHSELSSKSPPRYDLLQAFFKIARETNEAAEARVLAVKGIEEICASPSASAKMCSSLADEAINSVVTAMQSIPCHRDMQRWGCRALTHLASLLSSQNNDGGVHSISKVSAIKAVITAMEFHSGDSQVPLYGLCALLDLSWDSSSCYEIVASTGARPIVATMSNHPMDKTIRRSACFLLRKMSRVEEGINQILRDAPDISSVLLGTISESHSDSGVQADVCRTLYNLSSKKDCCKVMIGECGIQTVLCVMKLNKDNVEIHVTSFTILNRFLSNTEEMSTQTPEIIHNVAVTTLRSMMNLEKHRIIQLMSLKMLSLLSVHDISNAQYIVEKGGILSVLFAAENFAQCPDIQEKCFGVICALGVDPETCQMIGAEEGINAIVEGMKTHSTEKVVQEAGVLALKTMMKDSTCIDLVEMLGGREIIFFAMQVHADNILLHENGLAAIIKLKTKTFSTDHEEIILNSIATHTDSTKVRQWGSQCLFEMMQPKPKVLATAQGQKLAHDVSGFDREIPKLAPEFPKALVKYDAQSLLRTLPEVRCFSGRKA